MWWLELLMTPAVAMIAAGGAGLALLALAKAGKRLLRLPWNLPWLSARRAEREYLRWLEQAWRD